MQAMLLNFGDSTRVVCDSNNSPVVIDIGKVVESDIHDAHFHLIKRGIATDTLMVVPKGARVSDKLQSIVGLMRSMDEEPYDALLTEFNKVVPYDEENGFRPARHEMLRLLRDLARHEVAKSLHMQSRVVIHEEGDAVTRKPVGDDHSDGMLREIVAPPATPSTPQEPPPPAAAPEPKRQKGPPPIPKKASAREKQRSQSSKPVIKRERL